MDTIEADFVVDRTEEATRALQARAAVVAQRLLEQHLCRSRRKADARNYPIGLRFDLLTVAQQAARIETSQDVVNLLRHWLYAPQLPLSERQRETAFALLSRLQQTRGRYGMSPQEWEAFWALRDFVSPD